MQVRPSRNPRWQKQCGWEDSPFRLRSNYAGPSGLYGHPASARRATARRGRKSSALFAALLFAASGAAAQAKSISALSPSLFDVNKAIGSAVDGDTVIIPAGTATWTAKLAITKGITLKGQTTVAGAGTSSPTATDLTIIEDDTPATGPIIRVTSNAFFKMVGLTFVPGRRTTIGLAEGAIQLAGGANGVPATAQIEQCHFNKILQTRLVLLQNWTYGVFDNNFAELTSRQNAFLIKMSAYAYNGVPQRFGHGAFADYPWYGTDKFFFIETNTFLRNSPSPMIRGLTDGNNGCRFVVRYNYIRNAPIFDHGTEGAARGGRAFEVYNNTCNFTVPPNGPAVAWRSGTSLIHDNLVTVASGISYGTSGIICGLSEYREAAFHPGTPWGEADGTSVWDKNVTNCGANPLDKSQQTFVKGNAPYVFDSGKDDSSVNSAGVMHDSTKHWATNQWVGYSITNYGSAYQRLPTHSIGSFIISNTNNTITYKFGSSGGRGDQPFYFNNGDPYKIHRVILMMDQVGAGKSDLLKGNKPSINTTTNTASYAHSALEPCYSWNNTYHPLNGSDQVLGFDPARYPTNIAGFNYFNLGNGFATPPPDPANFYTATVNGTAYRGPFTYPHPLVSGVPSAHEPARRQLK